MVVIAEATSADEARVRLEDQLAVEAGFVWLSDAGPVGPAATYEVLELRLYEDGEAVVTGPAT